MRRTFIQSEHFREADYNGQNVTPLVRLAPSAPFTVNEETRTISYIFSNPLVARDFHTIAADAWDVGHFTRNPVFLWAHDANDLPIGRVEDIESRNGLLLGSVQYVEREIYPFADTVYRLVKGKYLSAVSTSWIPRAWKHAADLKRPEGIDFTAVELLEISQVPVPAVPGALATARSAGIDTGPIYQWAERALDEGGFLMIARTELETLRRDAKMATTSRRSSASTGRQSTQVRTRGMYAVANLAGLLGSLGYIQQDAEWEAELECDNSPVPGQLLDALKALGKVLVDMTIEEVSELVGDTDSAADLDVAAYVQSAKTRRQRTLRRMATLRRTVSEPRERAERERRTIATKSRVDALLRLAATLTDPVQASTAEERRRRAEERRRRFMLEN
jgi:hypothetical protein